MTLFKALHPRTDVDHLYVPRWKGGRGLLSVSDAVKVEKSALATHVSHHENPIMVKVKEYLMGEDTSITKSVVVTSGVVCTASLYMANGQTCYLTGMLTPQLYYEQHTLNLSQKLSLSLLKIKHFAVCTNWLGHHVLKTVPYDHCRKCGQFAETIEHNYCSWMPSDGTNCILRPIQCCSICHPLVLVWFL